MSDRLHDLICETAAYLAVFGGIFYLVWRYAPW
jgi:hypothetical protein